MWRSLVTRWHGGPEIAGSNPAIPTNSAHTDVAGRLAPPLISSRPAIVL